jgi:hypothetical protein
VCSSRLASQGLAIEDLEFNWRHNYQRGAVGNLLSTGKFVLEERKYAAAGKNFFDTLLNIKVSNGMNSSLQAPMFELSIRALLPTQNRAITNQYLSYFESLNSNAMLKKIQ